MHEFDQENIAFITDRGLYYYWVMLFGLKNTRETYQRLVNKMFKDQIKRNVEVYVEDMLVKSLQTKQHLSDLSETFQTLRKHKMNLNPSKYAFRVSAGKFLRFMVSQRGIEANPEKVKAKLDMQAPRNINELQRLARRVTALSQFISWATDKCYPFFHLLKKAFYFDKECDKVF